MLGLCDIFLFGSLRWQLVGRQCVNGDNRKSEMEGILEESPKYIIEHTFEKWRGHLTRCTDIEGEHAG
jgi:hypothetical protein